MTWGRGSKRLGRSKNGEEEPYLWEVELGGGEGYEVAGKLQFGRGEEVKKLEGGEKSERRLLGEVERE